MCLGVCVCVNSHVSPFAPCHSTKRCHLAHLVGISFIGCDLGRAVETLIYEFQYVSICWILNIVEYIFNII